MTKSSPETERPPRVPPQAQLHDPAYWRALCPALTVTEPGEHTVLPAAPLSERERAEARTTLDREGYLRHVGVFEASLCQRLAQSLHALQSAGLLSVFCFVYDEAWSLCRRLYPVLGGLLGERYAQLPDFWAWVIDPAAGERGWAPHRDRDGLACLRSDGSPKSVTAWVALTDATPLNGCIHVLPAHLDPGYLDDEVDPSPQDLLQRVRAVPASAGTVLVWNQRVLHWGGCASPMADSARVSVAFEFQRGDEPAFNEPLLRAPHALPSFSARMALIGMQLLQYTHMYGHDDALVSTAWAMIERSTA